jgi:hypothetical protein
VRSGVARTAAGERIVVTDRGRSDLLGQARDLLDAVVLIEVSREVCERSGSLDPAQGLGLPVVAP